MQRSLGSGVIVDAVRPRRHQQPRHRRRRPGEGLARRQARVRGRDRAEGPAHRSRGAARQGRQESASRSIEFGNSDELQVGDVVLAIGNPFGVGQTVTHGIVSAVARTQVGISDYQFFIQTDAAINPGNSGGALVDMAGRLVGINTAIFSRSGGSQGIGFAIPGQHGARGGRLGASAGGSAVKRPWLGAKLQAVTPELRAKPSTSSGRPARWSSPTSPTRARRRGRASRPATSSSRSTARRSTIPTPSTIASPPCARRQRRSSASCAAARRASSRSRWRPRRTRRATRSSSRRARRSWAPRSPTCRRRWPMSCGSTLDRGRCRCRGRRRLAGAELRLPARRHRARGQQRQDRQDPRPRAAPPGRRAGSGAITIQRGGQQISAVLGG